MRFTLSQNFFLAETCYGIECQYEWFSYTNDWFCRLRRYKTRNIFAHKKSDTILDLSWNLLKTVDFALFLPKYQHLEALYLNENHLNGLQGFTHFLFPSLHHLGITGNYFDCSYLKELMNRIIRMNITLIYDSWMPLNPHEMNIHGVECDPVVENEITSTSFMIDASTTTTTTKYHIREYLKLPRIFEVAINSYLNWSIFCFFSRSKWSTCLENLADFLVCFNFHVVAFLHTVMVNRELAIIWNSKYPHSAEKTTLLKTFMMMRCFFIK